MTTIIGIQTNTGTLDSIILGADTQLNYYRGEVPVKRKMYYKLISGDNWAIGHSGGVDDNLRKFYNKLTRPDTFKDFDKNRLEETIENAVKTKRFYLVDELNANHYKNDGEEDDAHEFIMAVNKPRLLLFRIDIFGNLISPEEDSNYIVLEDNEEKEIEKYLESQLEGETYDSGNADFSRCLRLQKEALETARQTNSSGISKDIIIIRKNQIIPYGRRIRESHIEADNQIFNKIEEEELKREK